jgi:intracellular multiplication protein IcmD
MHKKSLIFVFCSFLFAIINVHAGTSTVSTIGDVGQQVTSSFTSLTHLITAGSYLCGLAFSIAAIMKFKQHKDNPTQVAIGQPIAIFVIALALLFLPSTLSVTGETLFGGGATTAGPEGQIYCKSAVFGTTSCE